MKPIYLPLLAVLLTLGGCSTAQTLYRKESLWDMRGGYNDKKLADDRYKVTYGANGYVTKQQAQDLTTMRGAELCQAAGYDYFRMVTGTVTITRIQPYGITAPSTVAEFQCSHDAGPGWRKAADVIEATRAAYPKVMPKEKPGQPSGETPKGT